MLLSRTKKYDVSKGSRCAQASRQTHTPIDYQQVHTLVALSFFLALGAGELDLADGEERLLGLRVDELHEARVCGARVSFVLVRTGAARTQEADFGGLQKLISEVSVEIATRLVLCGRGSPVSFEPLTAGIGPVPILNLLWYKILDLWYKFKISGPYKI